METEVKQEYKIPVPDSSDSSNERKAGNKLIGILSVSANIFAIIGTILTAVALYIAYYQLPLIHKELAALNATANIQFRFDAEKQMLNLDEDNYYGPVRVNIRAENTGDLSVDRWLTNLMFCKSIKVVNYDEANWQMKHIFGVNGSKAESFEQMGEKWLIGNNTGYKPLFNTDVGWFDLNIPESFLKASSSMIAFYMVGGENVKDSNGIIFLETIVDQQGGKKYEFTHRKFGALDGETILIDTKKKINLCDLEVFS